MHAPGLPGRGPRVAAAGAALPFHAIIVLAAASPPFADRFCKSPRTGPDHNQMRAGTEVHRPPRSKPVPGNFDSAGGTISGEVIRLAPVGNLKYNSCAFAKNGNDAARVPAAAQGQLHPESAAVHLPRSHFNAEWVMIPPRWGDCYRSGFLYFMSRYPRTQAAGYQQESIHRLAARRAPGTCQSGRNVCGF